MPFKLARLLVAIDRAELGQPHRQIAIAARLRFVDHDVVRAVHRLEQIVLVVGHLDRRELAVGVVGIVARGLVEIDVADVRRVDRLIAAADQFVVEKFSSSRRTTAPLGSQRIRPEPTSGSIE